MSIRDSKRLRLRLSLAALGAVGLIYLLATATLQALSRHAESTGEVYPYKAEDWLRYLLPTLWPDDGKPLLLLTGPSAVRENFLYEDFAAAFPDYRVFQGGLSGGTLGDVMASLDYVERVHGTNALPDILVLGVSPRFMAEIPYTRGFAQGLDLYSRYYRVPGGAPDGFGLQPKAAIIGLRDHTRFLTQKQGPRYQAMFAWLVATAVGTDLSAWLSRTPTIRSILGPWVRLLSTERAMELGIHDYGLELASPYKYRGKDPLTVANLTGWVERDPDSWWRDVYGWDPFPDHEAIRARGAELLRFTGRHGIELFVVNLPDRAFSRARYEPGFTDRYHSLLHSTFDTVPFLDLRCLLEDDELYDLEHALLPGARRLTQRVIHYMNDVRAQGVTGQRGRAVSAADIAARWDASCPTVP